MPLLGAPLHYLLVSAGGLGWGNPAEEVKEGSGPQKKGEWGGGGIGKKMGECIVRVNPPGSSGMTH